MGLEFKEHEIQIEEPVYKYDKHFKVLNFCIIIGLLVVLGYTVF